MQEQNKEQMKKEKSDEEYGSKRADKRAWKRELKKQTTKKGQATADQAARALKRPEATKKSRWMITRHGMRNPHGLDKKYANIVGAFNDPQRVCIVAILILISDLIF